MTLPNFALMDDEHEAWKNLCTRLGEIAYDVREKLGAPTRGAARPMDVNDPFFNPVIDAIKLWGERLVALRVTQDEGVRQNALDDAITLVVDGRG